MDPLGETARSVGEKAPAGDAQSSEVTGQSLARDCAKQAGVPQSGGAMKTKRKSKRGDGAIENGQVLKNG